MPESTLDSLFVAILAASAILVLVGILLIALAAQARSRLPRDKRDGVASRRLATGIVLVSLGVVVPIVLGIGVLLRHALADSVR